MEADEEKQAAARARWLAELAAALDAADRLTSALTRWRGGSREAVALRSRILAARSEVEFLQRSGLKPFYPAEPDPFRTSGVWPRPRADQIP